MMKRTWCWAGGVACAIAYAEGVEGAEQLRVKLLAHATDVRAAVFVVASAPAARVAEGDSVPGTGLKLYSIDADGVQLRSDVSLLGRTVAIRLRDGEALDPHALEKARSDWDHPAEHPGSVQPVAALPLSPHH
ncbi:MAG: hypothetical protein ABIR62_12750 [Dokdonella sp.]